MDENHQRTMTSLHESNGHAPIHPWLWWLPYLYLLRVQIVMGLLLVALPDGRVAGDVGIVGIGLVGGGGHGGAAIVSLDHPHRIRQSIRAVTKHRLPRDSSTVSLDAWQV